MIFVQRCGRAETYFDAEYAKENNIPAEIDKPLGQSYKVNRSDEYMNSLQVMNQIITVDSLWRASRAV